MSAGGQSFPAPDSSEQVALTQLEARLTASFSDIPHDRISAVIRTDAHFDESPIRDFIALLVERRVRAELADASSPGQRLESDLGSAQIQALPS